MATRIFDKILEKAWVDRGIAKTETAKAAKWFRNKAKELGKNIKPYQIVKGEDWRMKNRVTVGHMYFFFYDAKHKATLPYWDKFPMIFPIGPAKGGFLGINLHYLDYTNRARLMDALMELRSDNRFSTQTKLVLSYRILNSAAQTAWFKPCVHHYLTRHVRSRFVHIHSMEWNIALMLPCEQFQKAAKTKVWAESRKIMGKKR